MVMDNKTKLHIILVHLLDRYEGKFIPANLDGLITENGDIENIKNIAQYIHELSDMEIFSFLEKKGLVRDPAMITTHVQQPEDQPQKSVEELAREMAEKMLQDMLKQQDTADSVPSAAPATGSYQPSGRIPITDAKLQGRVERFFKRLERLYPEHKVFALDSLDKDARKMLSELYPQAGYASDDDFLEAYGYERIIGDDVRALRNYTAYKPGEEPEVIKGKVESMLMRLEEYYPDRIISNSLQSTHKSLGKDAGGLYQWLGYENMQAMLEAYGYKYQAKAGRPTNDYDTVIQELLDKYKDKSKPESLGDLIFENPEYKSAIKTISNSSKERYGMTAAKYFKEIGLIRESRKKVDSQQRKSKSKVEDAAKARLEALYAELDPDEYGTLEEAMEALEGFVVKYKDENIIVVKCKEERPVISLPYGVDVIGLHAFQDALYLKVVELPDTVKLIKKDAFNGCSNLNSITVGESVETIETAAFKDCTSLEAIDLPASLQRIGDSCFEGCVKLEEVTMNNQFTMFGIDAFGGCPFQPSNTADENATDPSFFEVKKNAKNEVTVVRYTGNDRRVVVPTMLDGGMVKTIGKEAFNGNNYVQDVVIPDCVSTVNGGAFADCISLKRVKLSENVSKIVTNTFSGCTALEEINVPDGVTELKSGTFRTAPLKKLHIGKSLASLTARAFYEGDRDPVSYELKSGCDIREITIDPDNKTLSVEKTMILSKDGKTLFAMLGGDRTCVIPEGVETICDRAFEDQVMLTDVKLPSTVTTIGQEAFTETSLRSVEMPSALREIKERAFENCKKLTSVIFNEGLETIGNLAFRYDAIPTVMLPSTLKHLGNLSFDAFSDYTMHKQTIYIDENNETLMSDGCAIYSKESGELTLEVLYGSEFKEYLFGGYDDDDEDEDAVFYSNYRRQTGEKYTVKDGTVHIAAEACGRCSSLTHIDLPDTLRTVGDNAFYECKALRHVDLPEGLETIGEGAFRNAGLSEVWIPASVKEIGARAFAISSDSQWKSISVSTENTVFFTEDGNLYGNNPDGTTSLVVHFGNQESAVLRNDVARIQGGSFTNSIAKEIFIPSSVQYIDDKAISGCTKLKRLNIGLKDAGSKYKNAVIYLPKGESDKRDQYGYPDYEANRELARIREQYMDCLRVTPSGELFDYAKYDSLFDGVTEQDDKILIATDRLKSARDLVPVYEENYRRYLQKNATAAVATVVSEDDVNGLVVLADLDIFNEKNIDQVIEMANKAKRPEVLSYLMDFKNASIGSTTDDYEL